MDDQLFYQPVARGRFCGWPAVSLLTRMLETRRRLMACLTSPTIKCHHFVSLGFLMNYAKCAHVHVLFVYRLCFVYCCLFTWCSRWCPGRLSPPWKCQVITPSVSALQAQLFKYCSAYSRGSRFILYSISNFLRYCDSCIWKFNSKTRYTVF